MSYDGYLGTGTDYMSSMDRGGDSHGHSHGHDCSHHGDSGIGVGIGDLGFSFGLGPVPNVHAIKSKLHPGSRKLELAFTGSGKGSGQQQTPEYYGEKQRRALREISTVNRVDITTHSSLHVSGLAGDARGQFSKAAKRNAIDEVRRAIEFAADVGGGGSVVVHTGELARPVKDAKWNQEGKWAGKFEMYSDEDERAGYVVLDTRTGGQLTEARRNTKVSRPIWKRYGEDDEFWGRKDGKSQYKDENGEFVKKGDYIDYFGRKVRPEERVAKYDEKEKTFITRQLNWNDLTEEAKEMTLRAREDYSKWSSKSHAQLKKESEVEGSEFNKSLWRERILDAKEKGLGASAIEVRPEEAQVIAQMEHQAAVARGWALNYSADFKQTVANIEKLKVARQVYQEKWDRLDPAQRNSLLVEIRDLIPQLQDIPSDHKKPTEVIDRQINIMEGRIEQGRESAAQQWAQSQEALERARHARSAQSYAFGEATDGYAQLGVSAYRQTQEIKGKRHHKKPIQVAMENLFPEGYGAHPDELIELVQGSRKAMAQKLRQNLGMGAEEARKAARTHITSTLDTGHLNIWRKWWKADPKKTVDANDKEFNKWALEHVEKMVKAGIVGHVHLDDNYGYQDDHLAPGEGNTPIVEMIKILKKNGYKGDMIVEPGADFSSGGSMPGFKAVTKAWEHLGLRTSQGSASSSNRSWNDIQYGSFGQTQPPYFTFGGYVPSEDFRLWSGVQLE